MSCIAIKWLKWNRCIFTSHNFPGKWAKRVCKYTARSFYSSLPAKMAITTLYIHYKVAGRVLHNCSIYDLPLKGVVRALTLVSMLLYHESQVIQFWLMQCETLQKINHIVSFDYVSVVMVNVWILILTQTLDVIAWTDGNTHGCVHITVTTNVLGPSLLIWFNFNPSIEK